MTKEKESESTKKSNKIVSSDESDSESVAKENIHSDQNEEPEEEKLEIIKTKPSKKRKKKLKIFDDSSNSSSHSATDMSNQKEKPVLSEIVNSDNSQNIKLNHLDAPSRVPEEPLTAAANDHDDSESDDDDMPLGMKLSMPKRQRLILSDGDDD